MPADPAPENSVTGDDERRAEIEAAAEAIRDIYVGLGTRAGLHGSVGLLDERSRRRIAGIILRRAPGPSSRDAETDAHLVAERAIDAYLAAIPSSRERDADHDGMPGYWICERCGQPLGRDGRCNSGLHVGPGEEANGMAVHTTDLVADLVAARARIEELEGEWDHITRAEHETENEG